MLPNDPLVKVIPGRGDEVTAARLRRVAEIVETYPEQHDQEFWFAQPVDDDGASFTEEPDLSDDLRYSRSLRLHCGTTRCAAGWAVVLTPVPQLRRFIGTEDDFEKWGYVDGDWAAAGAYALGLQDEAAKVIFQHGGGARVIARALRRMAELPESERSGKAARQALGTPTPQWAAA